MKKYTSKIGGFYQKYKYEIWVALVIFILWLLWKKYKNAGSPGEQNANVVSNVTPIGNIKGAKISSTKARSIAEKLFVAMNTFWGTDEEVIYSELANLTKEDYALVHYQFGNRKYSAIFGEKNILGVEMDLNGWLVNELKASEIRKLCAINPIFNEIL
ncbi:MAG: hypothetical protein Q4G08_02900 [Capnocytophaga sp.]|nr:hypothetical protein [Capnocytophaga sp.]